MFIDKKIYQPKGSMCLNCKNRSEDCSKLPFETMPVVERWMGQYIVACKEYKKIKETE